MNINQQRIFYPIFLLSLVITGCSPEQISTTTIPPVSITTLTPIPTKTPTQTPTTTPQPTIEPTATKDPYDFDIEKFNNYPQSYQYLLHHREEFVQSPDPVNYRKAFDRWFTEELIPALGPKAERPVLVENYGGGGGAELWKVIFNRTWKEEYQLTAPPPFFWFEHGGIVYPVPCITTETSGYPEITRITLCPALFDSPALWTGMEGMEGLIRGGRINSIAMYYDPEGYRNDLSWGDAQALVTSVGDYPLDDNAVKFGFGTITMMRNGTGVHAEPIPKISKNPSPVFESPKEGQTIDYNETYQFSLIPMENVESYLWGFKQDDELIWENFRDTGSLSGLEFQIRKGSELHSKFSPGEMQVIVRAWINGGWSDESIITVHLAP